ncbi:DUF58 domain-containing protein [Acetobacter estunensis]|uniref:DUF58 domain-containing protein n=1 Tax=Acetobacter estunensis TaxID=104097 RepID=UPI0020C383EB|nr:DUF58 domain-containing protein [Acetobacter estunensis]
MATSPRTGLFARARSLLQEGKASSIDALSSTQARTADTHTSEPALLATEADRLAAPLPALVMEAERIAATVATGLHGRRRAGPGETFWQFRPALPGESVSRIDWRQSARSHRAQVRETEAENAQTIYLWCDLSPSMFWRSNARTLPLKRDRAILLLLGIASLLERSDERVRLLTPQGPAMLPPGAGRIAMRIGLTLETLARQDSLPALPAAIALPRHARLIVASDLLCPDQDLDTLLRGLAGNGIGAHLIQIHDPAERALPWSGRVRFEGTEGEPPITLPRVETLREDYGTLFDERVRKLRTLADRCGHTLLTHSTDMSAASALLTLGTSLQSHRTGGRA